MENNIKDRAKTKTIIQKEMLFDVITTGGIYHLRKLTRRLMEDLRTTLHENTQHDKIHWVKYKDLRKTMLHLIIINFVFFLSSFSLMSYVCFFISFFRFILDHFSVSFSFRFFYCLFFLLFVSGLVAWVTNQLKLSFRSSF